MSEITAVGPVADPSRIVVGIDDSAGASHALAWAAAEAARSGATLEIHTAYNPVFVFATAADIKAGMEDLVATAVERVKILAPEVTAVGVVHEQAAVHALVQASEQADLLVLGSRGRGGITGLLLGSVSQQCAQHAKCPVVIVPNPRASA